MDRGYSKETTTITFLRHKETNRPIRLEKEETGSNNCCGEYQYTLRYYNDETYPIWYAEDLLHAQWVLNNPTYWYNSAADQPWHSFELDEIEICTRVQTVEITDTLLSEDNRDVVKDLTLKVLKRKLLNTTLGNDRGVYEHLIEEAGKGEYSLSYYECKEEAQNDTI